MVLLSHRIDQPEYAPEPGISNALGNLRMERAIPLLIFSRACGLRGPSNEEPHLIDVIWCGACRRKAGKNGLDFQPDLDEVMRAGTVGQRFQTGGLRADFTDESAQTLLSKQQPLAFEFVQGFADSASSNSEKLTELPLRHQPLIR